MKKSEEKKQVIRSMRDFEKIYFPKSFEKRLSEKETDAKTLGVTWAKKSIEMAKELI
ncbi:hypothetical protein FHEFKHOI_01118 [Candidatus Methanoperedenaceae archaeon GB50]|nr:hypothetical protein AIOGIFDO_01109 [Candidatus Methanoperedenaceae archaeon GB37]CAD7771906.1 hypothetical protein FHEFKHOI_01118 [Candidatus Methanoperedenaceae archaeon GB50]CAD7776664.1 MAG: hypothetical protein KBONHNOK_00951 [Candidatus Methanoperedenaceae archaeon GB50]